MFSQFQPRRLAALALAAMLTGCASAPATHVVTDPQTDLRTYRTFSGAASRAIASARAT